MCLCCSENSAIFCLFNIYTLLAQIQLFVMLNLNHVYKTLHIVDVGDVCFELDQDSINGLLMH